jgi:hypothetical protein
MGIVAWGMGIAVSVAALVACASMRADAVIWAWVHLAVAAISAMGLALAGVATTRALAKDAAKEQVIAAASARSIGMIWTWAALALVATYATRVLVWWEWWHFTVAAIVAAGLCFFFERTLLADANNPDADDTMMRFAETLAIIQLAGMGVALLGLLIDGKMSRFLTVRYTDWAANAIFFFGALGIALVSAHDIQLRRRTTAVPS